MIQYVKEKRRGQEKAIGASRFFLAAVGKQARNRWGGKVGYEDGGKIQKERNKIPIKTENSEKRGGKTQGESIMKSDTGGYDFPIEPH